MRRNHLATLFVWVLFLQGCVEVGGLAPPEPQTPAQAVVIAYASIEATAKTVKEAYDLGRITAEQKNVYRDQLLDAYDTVGKFELATVAGLPTEAPVTLEQVSTILTAIEKELK